MSPRRASASVRATPLDAARDALAAAERAHATATERADAARATFEAAALVVSDAADDAAALAAWRGAREAGELASLALAGAARKVDAARGAMLRAEHDAARDALARALPLASRAALFDAVAVPVATLVACDAVPRVDPYAATETVDLLADLHDEHARDVARALALRAIRAEVTAQHAAVADVLGAFGLAGEPRPPVACVPESHVLALASLERAALRGADVDSIARVLASPEWCAAYGDRAAQIASEARPALRGDPAALLDFGRMLARTGDPHAALAATVRAHETPADRERREHNDRAIARGRATSDAIWAHNVAG